MPNFVNIHNLDITPERPPVTVFDGTLDLTAKTGVDDSIERGNQNFTLPEWATCGVQWRSDCPIEPRRRPTEFCYNESPIAANWGDVPGQVQLKNFMEGVAPEVMTNHTPVHKRDGCVTYKFRPLDQDIHLEKIDCETPEQMATTAVNNLEAYSHRLAALHLMYGINGNPSLPLMAEVVNPTDKPVVSDTAGLECLHEHLQNLSFLVVPWKAILQLEQHGLIHRTPDKPWKWEDSLYTPVITDPYIYGDVGPSDAGPWDGETPIDPSDPTTGLTQIADKNSVWVYLTPPIYVGETAATINGEPKENFDKDTAGNHDSVIVNLQTLPFFAPYNVKAARIQLNRKGCND